jgi:Lon protease-like protein
MRGELIPLFPLQAVLLPHSLLPLHIFEERYKEMIGEVLRTSAEFGVVLARDNGVLNAGCTATVERVVQKYDDGRIDLIALGRRRFSLLELNTERSFLRGRIEEIVDNDHSPVSAKSRRDALARHREYADATDSETETPDPDGPELSFVLAAISPDLQFRQLLLGMRSESERIEIVAKHLAGLIQKHSIEDAMQRVARSNGHGKHWKGTP